MFDFKPNSVTGQLEANFNAKLISVGENFLTNTNGIKYKVGTIEFTNAQGALVQKSARIYEKNLSYGMPVGQSYLCTVSKYIDSAGATQYDIKCSHLQGAQRATSDDFEGVAVTSNALAEQAV